MSIKLNQTEDTDLQSKKTLEKKKEEKWRKWKYASAYDELIYILIKCNTSCIDPNWIDDKEKKRKAILLFKFLYYLFNVNSIWN